MKEEDWNMIVNTNLGGVLFDTRTAYTFNMNGWESNSNEKILDNMDIKDIERYLRKKKIQNLEKNEQDL